MSARAAREPAVDDIADVNQYCVARVTAPFRAHMFNEALSDGKRQGPAVHNEFVLAGFIIAVGLCIAGAGTHLYQGFAREQAELRYDGATFLHTIGFLLISFVCGPYIMLQMGWRHEGESDGTMAIASVLVGSLVGFGWAFVTGLLFMGLYVAIFL